MDQMDIFLQCMYNKCISLSATIQSSVCNGVRGTSHMLCMCVDGEAKGRVVQNSGDGRHVCCQRGEESEGEWERRNVCMISDSLKC